MTALSNIQGDPSGCPYRRAGSGSSPLLALHGLGGSSTQPLSLFDAEVFAAYDVIAPDLRAHGANRMPVTPEYLSFEQLAQDVRELLDSLELTAPVRLVGISMGAGVAVQLLAEGLDTAGVVLVRPAWGWLPSPDNLAIFPRIASLLGDCPASEARRRLRATQDYADLAAVSSAAAEALLAQFDDDRAVERRERLRRLPADAPARPGRGHDPLVVTTPRDPVHPLALADELAADLDGRLQVVAPRYESPSRHASEVSRAVCGERRPH